MPRPPRYPASILLALSCFWVGVRPAAAATPTRPHIVIFLCDDLGRTDCEIYEPRVGIPTPNLSRIARAGMVFTHAFVASPSCAPSRAALLTGVNPARSGAMFNHTLPDPAIRRWPAYFRAAGYETASFGKSAHGASAASFGFDHASHFNSPERIDAAVAWLERRKPGRPLCLFVGTNWPHTPWPETSELDPAAIALPPTQVDTPEQRAWRARYAQAIILADRELGRVYDTARRALGDDTLFLFSSDHGAAFPFGKWNLYDEGIRVPLVAVWPGRIAAGSVSAALVSWLDLLPTCLEATGVEPPPGGRAAGEIDGRSFLGVLRGMTTDHRERVFATHSGDGTMNEYPIRAVRTRDWKYIRNLSPDAEHHTHIDRATNEHGGGFWPSWIEKAKADPDAAAAVARYHRRPAEELYDLRADPWERHNLAAEPASAARLRELRRELDSAMAGEADRGLATERERKPAPSFRKKA